MPGRLSPTDREEELTRRIGLRPFIRLMLAIGKSGLLAREFPSRPASFYPNPLH
jgi:hypothetical protein